MKLQILDVRKSYILCLDNPKREMLYINLSLVAKIKPDEKDAENFGCRR